MHRHFKNDKQTFSFFFCSKKTHRQNVYHNNFNNLIAKSTNKYNQSINNNILIPGGPRANTPRRNRGFRKTKTSKPIE